ncbi:MAG: DNA methyltransferase [Candidatus Bathyarchaeota archaeon]
MPKAEVRAILDSRGFSYKILDEKTQLLNINTTNLAIEMIGARRPAYTRECCTNIFSCDDGLEEILKHARETNFERFIKPGETFLVRVKRIGASSKHLGASEVERKLGGVIFKELRTVRVDMEKPRRLFLGVLTDGTFTFGLKLAGPPPKQFHFRTPRRKPFFHPSSLQPKLARCMVNLSRAKEGKVVFDPFCGTGTILIEAELMGFETVGCDLMKKMIKGSRLNLNHYNLRKYHLMVSDALNLPFNRMDVMVTDPPYGRSATTKGLSTFSIIRDSLSQASNLPSPTANVCIASPRSIDVCEIGEKYGFKVLEKHFVYVHRSLTREIAVLTEV